MSVFIVPDRDILKSFFLLPPSSERALDHSLACASDLLGLSVCALTALIVADLGWTTQTSNAAPAKASATTSAPCSKPAATSASHTTPPQPGPTSFNITEQYAQRIADKVDHLISTKLYNATLARDMWPKIYAAQRPLIIKSGNLKELSDRLNGAIAELHSSHCEFVTVNDETYYFLDTLFCNFNKKLPIFKMNYTGIITGGVKKDFNSVRNVLDGSPGAKAGMKRNDIIEAVDGQPFVGECSFAAKSGKNVELKIKRGRQHLTVTVVPKFVRDYDQYVEAMEKSTRVIQTPAGKIGYVHYWGGGNPSHEMFEHILGQWRTRKDGLIEEQGLAKTDGLILDLRDGYGGASGTDLDILYRNPNSHPDFISTSRSGDKFFSRDYYDKPVVALINGGSRSAKEMFAWGLKNSGRAKLVGQTTAGFFLAGQFMPIDERCALYLAVADVSLNSERLEGKGVSPDIEVPDDAQHPDGYDEQFERAKSELLELLQARTSEPKEK